MRQEYEPLSRRQTQCTPNADVHNKPNEVVSKLCNKQLLYTEHNDIHTSSKL